MLQRIAQLAIAAPRRIIAVAALVTAATAISACRWPRACRLADSQDPDIGIGPGYPSAR